MQARNSNVRLFVDHPLGPGQTVPVDRDQSNYLFAVMRLKEGAEVTVFNGRDGAWTARVVVGNKRGGVLQALEQTAPQVSPPDLWLLFAPIKKARTDFIVEKAVELGAARICPVQTAFTSAERIRRDRLQAHAVEAAEQCGATFVPEVAALEKLSRVLDGWDPARKLIFCDEGLAGHSSVLPDGLVPPAAILIGPEGGFSDEERIRIAAVATPISLGPRILRADTAAVSAITLWQAAYGDWT